MASKEFALKQMALKQMLGDLAIVQQICCAIMFGSYIYRQIERLFSLLYHHSKGYGVSESHKFTVRIFFEAAALFRHAEHFYQTVRLCTSSIGAAY